MTNLHVDRRVPSFLALMLIGAVMMVLPSAAQAQFNNKPYSFNTPDGSVGMSRAARQAIINDQLYNSRPDNILRGVTGELLSVEKAKGGTAIIRSASGEVLPGYRGTSVLVRPVCRCFQQLLHVAR